MFGLSLLVNRSTLLLLYWFGFWQLGGNGYKYQIVLNYFLRVFVLSISIFLISQLSIVSGTFMSGSVFSYNYPLRVAMNCLAIVCAAAAAFGKTKKLILTVKILLSIFIIAFILIFGMENNAIS